MKRTRKLYIVALSEALARLEVREEWPRVAIRGVKPFQLGIWEVRIA